MTSHDAPSGSSGSSGMSGLSGHSAGDPAMDQPNEHRLVWDAIAWVVAGTATPEQRRLVQAHLPHCAHCRDELELQRNIHRGMQDAHYKVKQKITGALVHGLGYFLFR